MPNPPDHIDSLIERLRRTVDSDCGQGGPNSEFLVNPDGPEAAQTISQCRDEMQRLREENKLLSEVLRRTHQALHHQESARD